MHTKAFNPQVFLEFLCYSVFAGLMFFLVSSGKYLSYVTPRMEPYLYFTAIVMVIWACAGLGRLFRPQYKVRCGHCFVLAIPILFLLLPHSPLSTAGLTAKYIGGNAFYGLSGQRAYGNSNKQASSGSSDFKASTSTTTEDSAKNSTIPNEDSSINTTSPEDNLSNSIGTPVSDEQADVPENSISDSMDTTVPAEQAGVPEDSYAAALPGLDVKNKKITVSNDDFGLWISQLYAEVEKYKGYKIAITGFIFKDPKIFKENEFVPARLMMACCAADLAPVGVTCKYEKAPQLKADSWVTVEGTLSVEKYKVDGIEYKDPQIVVTKITPAEKVEGYIYLTE